MNSPVMNSPCRWCGQLLGTQSQYPGPDEGYEDRRPPVSVKAPGEQGVQILHRACWDYLKRLNEVPIPRPQKFSQQPQQQTGTQMPPGLRRPPGQR